MKENEEILKDVIDPARRTFFRNAGRLGLGAAASGLILSHIPALEAQATATAQDTANQILTAALVAEDLATTFYYNGLIGGVITDPNLAGPGGTAVNPSATAKVPNLNYLRAALNQEISHANLLRAVANLGASAATDPYQTFYFPAGTFNTIGPFVAILEALESAFIGAYLTAVREFATLAGQTGSSVPDGPYGGPYSAAQLRYFSQVAASIMGVEAEHRVLGGVIGGGVLMQNPNSLYYEQSDGLLTVYNGPNSAVAALTPFLTPSTGPGYPLAPALVAASAIGLASNGTPPSYLPVSFSANPNPIPVTAGQLGVTTISWSAPGSSVIQVRVNAPNGPLLADYGNAGSAMTGNWVTNGMTFYLQDGSGSKDPTQAANTLATVTATLASM